MKTKNEIREEGKLRIKPDEIYLTSEQVAERYHMNMIALATWRVRNQGPKFIKAGRKVLYPMSALIAWENSRLVKNTQEAHALEK